MLVSKQATLTIPPGRLEGALNAPFPLLSGFASASIMCTLISSTRQEPFAGKTTYASLTASFIILGGHLSEADDDRYLVTWKHLRSASQETNPVNSCGSREAQVVAKSAVTAGQSLFDP